MQSPFVEAEAPAVAGALVAPEDLTPEEIAANVVAALDPALLEELDRLVQEGVAAKKLKDANTKIYDKARARVAEILAVKDIKVTTAFGEIKTKENKSDWVYSDATEDLMAQVKTQQEIEKRRGIAKAGKTVVSADINALK